MKMIKPLLYVLTILFISISVVYVSTASAQPAITSPAPSSTLSGSTVIFNWTAGGTSVDEWWLHIGTTIGGSDIHDSGSLALSTSTWVNGLPTDGSPIHVRLWYRQGTPVKFNKGKSWSYVDYTYIARTISCPCWDAATISSDWEFCLSNQSPAGIPSCVEDYTFNMTFGEDYHGVSESLTISNFPPDWDIIEPISYSWRTDFAMGYEIYSCRYNNPNTGVTIYEVCDDGACDDDNFVACGLIADEIICR